MKIRDRIKELRRVRASTLKPSPRNWRTHSQGQQDALRGVLAEVGYNRRNSENSSEYPVSRAIPMTTPLHLGLLQMKLSDAPLVRGLLRAAAAVKKWRRVQRITTSSTRLGPPRYYAPVCIQWPWGFQCGPAGYREVTEVEKGRGPIVVEPRIVERT